MIGGEALRERLGKLARARAVGIAHERAAAGGHRGASEEYRPGGAGAEVDCGASEERESQGWRSATGCSEPQQDAEASGPQPTSAPEPAVPAVRSPLGVEAYLPGGEWRDAGGAVFVHERLRSEVERRRPDWGRLQAAPDDEPELAAIQALGLEHALFVDLETGGLSGSPVFLAGTMHWNGTDFVLRQYFARHYGEEAALLRALGESAGGFAFLVTFNGKSYDVPFLRSRSLVHGVALRLPERHLDLLHPARRRWKRRLADCRLQTLEWRVCRRRRAGDVPSDEVPGLYHDYVCRGDPYRLIPVFHHNLLDVLTMGEILSALCRPDWERRPAGVWLDPGPDGI